MHKPSISFILLCSLLLTSLSYADEEPLLSLQQESNGGMTLQYWSPSTTPWKPTPTPPDPLKFLEGAQGKSDVGLFSGEALFTHPISLPPGRNNITPKVTLRYSSQNKSFGSIIGYGWTLPIDSIYRSAQYGVNNIYEKDEFFGQLKGEIIELLPLDTSGDLYGARDEASFLKIERLSSGWKTTDKEGLTYTFGTQSNARQDDPGDSNRIFKWMLEKVEDPYGNFMTYSYSKSNGQIYPDTISYTGYETDPGIYEVKFIFTSVDPMTSAQIGFQVTSDKILSKIEIYSSASGSSQLVYEYHLEHDSVNNAVNLLTGLEPYADGQSLPPTEFTYYNGSEASVGKAIYLLQTVDYPYGASETFAYAPSTAYKIGNSQANPLPFIIPTLVSRSLTPEPGGQSYTTMYHYQGGHYFYDSLDAYQKEYAGFGQVWITDPQNFVSKYYFHQSELSPDNSTSSLKGEYQDDLSKKGKIYREELYDDDDNLYQVKIYKWDTSDLSEEHPSKDRKFVFLSRLTVADYDGDNDYKAKAITHDYDSYGNQIEEVNYGEVTLDDDAGNFTDIGSDKTEENIAYAVNTTDYLLSYPKQYTLYNQGSNLIGEVKLYYDDLSFGQISKGAQTKKQQLVSSGTYLTELFEYDTKGLLTQTTNARGYDTDLSYDSFDLHPTILTNAKSQTTNYDYDYRFGKVKEMIDPNGAKTIHDYDDFGRTTAIKVSDPSSPSAVLTQKSFTYGVSSYPFFVEQTDNTHNASIEVKHRSYLDGLGRIIQVRDESEGTDQYRVSSILYDARGNVAKNLLPTYETGLSFTTIDANDYGTAFTYDPLNRKTSIVTPLGTISISYDQWEQQTIDANNHQKDHIFDARNNLIQVKEYIDSQTLTTDYEYNALNQLIGLTDSLGNEKAQTFDLLDRKLTETDWHTPSDTTYGTKTWTYDANGNVTSLVDAKSQTTNFTYDELDRLAVEDFTGESGTEGSYVYDTGTYGIGRLASATTLGGSKSFSYDILGRIASTSQVIDGQTFGMSFTYDLLDNPLTITYPDTTTVSYEYGNAGQLESLDRNTDPVVTNIDYAPSGGKAQIDFANGVSTTNTYDPSKMYRLTHRLTSTISDDLQDIAYTFDAVGNITSVSDSSDTDAAKDTTYTYDDLYRLTQVSVTNAANSQNYTRSYTYDDIGNLLSRSDQGSYSYAGSNDSTSSATNASPHAVTSIASQSFIYDDNGNLTSDGTWTHTWDYKDRLSSSTDGATTLDYLYDEAKNRILKHNTTTSKKTYYVDKYYDLEESTGKVHIYAGDTKVATQNIQN